MKPSAKCKSCQAPIRWVLVGATGKRMPLNPTADLNGNVWVTEWEDGTPVVAVASADSPVPSGEPMRYTSHFQTCPNANEHRSKK